MQNLADQFVIDSSKPLPPAECAKHLPTFLLYNERKKTISPTKTASTSSCGTPEQAYRDFVASLVEALSKNGKVQLPDISRAMASQEELPLHLLFHPAVGPLHQVIGQKIRGGVLEKGAFLELEIAEVALFHLQLQGSLRILASSPLGSFVGEELRFDGRESRCYLRDVTVNNRGIDTAASPVYWKNQVSHAEALEIFLGEGAEFWAEGVSFVGDYRFFVPPYHRLVVQQLPSGEIRSSLDRISVSSWHWSYKFSLDDSIELEWVPYQEA